MARRCPPIVTSHGVVRQGLRASGFVDGQNVAIELRYGAPQQLPELAAELIRLKVDVIFANGDLAPRVAQNATEAIPIVAMGDDFLGAGVIVSLSRPGRNTTGLTILSPELSAKRLEVLSDMIPGLSRVTALWDPTSGASQVTLTESAAQSLNLKLQVLECAAVKTSLGRFAQHAILRQKPSTFSLRPFSRHCIGRSSLSRRNTGFRQSISGRNTPRSGASVLRTQSCGDVAAVRNHRGKGPQGREACGPTGRATDEVRVGGEPQNREVSRPHHSAFGAFACRRGDRIISISRTFVAAAAHGRL